MKKRALRVPNHSSPLSRRALDVRAKRPSTFSWLIELLPAFTRSRTQHMNVMKRTIDRLANALGLLKRSGYSGISRRIRASIWYDTHYIILSKRLMALDSPIVQRNVVFRLATLDDVAWLTGQMLPPADRAERLLQQQFCPDDRTVIGHSLGEDRELVFSAWLSRHDHCLQWLGHARGSGDMTLRRVYVPPSYRRKGFAELGLLFAEYAAYQAGANCLWSLVQTDNRASLRLHDKLSFQYSEEPS